MVRWHGAEEVVVGGRGVLVLVGVEVVGSGGVGVVGVLHARAEVIVGGGALTSAAVDLS